MAPADGSSRTGRRRSGCDRPRDRARSLPSLRRCHPQRASNTFCPGQPGQIVVLRVAYPLPAILPLNLFSRTVGVVSDVPKLSGSYHILMSSALFQEENYSGSYTSPSGC